MTNQAIQVLQGPYITNTYGGGISCQGPTANFTPYITHARNDKDPFETFYMEPQYDNRDFEETGRSPKEREELALEEWYDDRTYTNSEGEVVRAYEDGQDMTITVLEMQGDGVPDNPGTELWQNRKNWYFQKLQHQYWSLQHCLCLLMVDYKSVVSKQQKHRSHYKVNYLLTSG